jgi:hypothetical protein
MTENETPISVSGLVGKAGEALVAAELLRKKVHVAYPAYDGGIDLLAYSEINFKKAVPIQVKARSSTCYVFHKSWFKTVEGIVLVQVWHVETVPEFYIFRDTDDVAAALGAHAESDSWTKKGGWNTTNPGKGELDRMQAHRDKWERITDQLKAVHEQ